MTSEHRPSHHDHDMLQREASTISKPNAGASGRRTTRLSSVSPSLQSRRWPAVKAFAGLPLWFDEFLRQSVVDQRAYLSRLRATPDEYGQAIHQALGIVYSHLYGYHDSATYLRRDDELELRLGQAKIALEGEMFDHWLPPAFSRIADVVDPVNRAFDQRTLAQLFDRLSVDNPGVHHPLFDFIATDAPRGTFLTFLFEEVIRNEIVDDEVARLVSGHQGLLKSAACENLYDECGRNRVEQFHTYWLRRLVDHTGTWEELAAYRCDGRRPWFNGIASNVFNALLTRPGLKFAAYGYFLITESWVAPHFEKILSGMDRLGLNHPDVAVYFTAHAKLDPLHGRELIAGLADQVPELGVPEIQAIIYGATLAIAGVATMYDRMLGHLRGNLRTA